MRCGRRGKRAKEKNSRNLGLKRQKELLLETIINCSGVPFCPLMILWAAGLSWGALRSHMMLAGASVTGGQDWGSTSKMAHVHDCCKAGPSRVTGKFGSLPLSIKVHSFIHLFIYINNERLPSIYQVLARIVASHPSRRDIFLGSLKTRQLTFGR